MASRDDPASRILNRDRLVFEARMRTGLGDLGSGWQDGLDQLLASLCKIPLAPSAARSVASRIGNYLDARLIAHRGFATYPAVLAQPIRKPLIIAGLVRSGTTVLHKLLSIDPQFQVPEYWLVHAPMPRPPRDGWSSSPAYQAIAKRLGDHLDKAPELKEHHGQAADAAEETLFIQAQTFCCNMFMPIYGVPEYDEWFQAADHAAGYGYVADILRLIGLNDPDKRWLLKNPTDLYSLDAVLQTFPDAWVVQTHRDPVQAIPSVAGTVLSGRRAVVGGEPNREAIGNRENEFWAAALSNAEQARAKYSPLAIDVEFSDFMRDQLATVRAIYDHFGLVLAGEVEAEMAKWLDANPRRSASLQRVAPEEFGLSAASIKSTYEDYRGKRGYR